MREQQQDAWFVQQSLGGFISKPGVRGHPGLPEELQAMRPALGSGRILDASGLAGMAAAVMGAEHVLEPSAAALSCSRGAVAGLPWDAQPGAWDTVVLAPPADRGTARVLAEIQAAARALAAGGRLLLVTSRDRGAKRYEKFAAGLFTTSEVVAREGGMRLLQADGPLGAAEPETLVETPGGLVAVAGTYAAGKLDPGTALLLPELPHAGDADVLDIGCGYGTIALHAAAQGGRVTAVDDDLGAVRSARLNAERTGQQLNVLHSDIDAALEGETFDFVFMNPPFHVGHGVRLDLPRAFIRAAERRVRPGGEIWLVANAQLPYERELPGAETVRLERGFKVIRARR